MNFFTLLDSFSAMRGALKAWLTRTGRADWQINLAGYNGGSHLSWAFYPFGGGFPARAVRLRSKVCATFRGDRLPNPGG
jgi:hypothetical protein